MALRVPSPASQWRCALLLVLAGVSCQGLGPARAPESIAEGDPALRERAGVLTRSGAPFSGYVVKMVGTQLVARTPYVDGKRHGTAYAWHPDGGLAYEKRFRRGDREGTHTGYWPGGQLQFVYRYEHDLFEGEQLAYYKNGVRSELRHFHQGREEGQQTTWDGTGRVLSNYTFKQGRRYGIVGSFNCISVRSQ